MATRPSVHSVLLHGKALEAPLLERIKRVFSALQDRGTTMQLSPAYAKLLDANGVDRSAFGLQIYDDATAEKLTLLAIEAGFRNFFASVLVTFVSRAAAF